MRAEFMNTHSSGLLYLPMLILPFGQMAIVYRVLTFRIEDI